MAVPDQPQHLTPMEAGILAYIREHPGSDARTIADGVGGEFRTVRRRLNSLQALKLVGTQPALDIGPFAHRFYPEGPKNA